MVAKIILLTLQHLTVRRKQNRAMKEITLKIVGVQYAANPQRRQTDEETPEMQQRTLEMLTWLDNERPQVVLMRDRSNPVSGQAVMARAMGRHIGYVADEQTGQLHDALHDGYRYQSLIAIIEEVVVKPHGWLTVSVTLEYVSNEEYESDWRHFMDEELPMLPPDDDHRACEEALFMIDESFLFLDEDNARCYLDIWVEHARHDLSYQAKEKRHDLMMAIESDNYMKLDEQLEALRKQTTAMCGRRLMKERIEVWWKQQQERPEVELIWNEWRLKWGGSLQDNLNFMEDLLRRMPEGLYAQMSKPEVFFAKLYYLNTPRNALNAVLTLLILRKHVCQILGLSLDPRPADDYNPPLTVTDVDACDELVKQRWREEEREYIKRSNEGMEQREKEEAERKRVEMEQAEIEQARREAEATTREKEKTTPTADVDNVDNVDKKSVHTQLPPSLQTPVALMALKKLQQEGLLDEHYQPCAHVSNAEKGTIVALLSEKLHLRNQWVLFARLWDMNDKTLRQSKYKGESQLKTQIFAKRISRILS